jgi:hypothetical protein
MTGAMSAFGPKRTSLVAPHMSAFGSKADIGDPFRSTRFCQMTSSATKPMQPPLQDIASNGNRAED